MDKIKKRDESRLSIAKNKILFQNEEKQKRLAELIIAAKELVFQKKEKQKRAAELILANKELSFQNKEKEKRAVALIVANKELALQNGEKQQRAAELIVANNKLIFQNAEKEKLAAELHTAMIELSIQNEARKKTEEKITYVNRLYAFSRQINQAIVYAEDEKKLFKEACRISIGVGKFKAGWIGMIDTENKKINVVEECGLQQPDLKQFTNLSCEQSGPQDHVVHTGNSYVCNNILNDPAFKSWKQLAAAKGIGSCMIIPIKKTGSVIGTFNLYAPETDFFHAAEISLLEGVTGDISFALGVFEKQQLKFQADEQVKHKELRLNQAQAISHLGSWELDFSTGILTWSEEALRIHGLSPEESEQSYESWISVIHPDDLDHVLQVIKEAESTLSNSSFAHRIIRKDGSIRQVFSQAHYEFNNEGKPTGMYGITHDVTDMKEAEGALQKSEKIFTDLAEFNQKLIDMSPMGITSYEAISGKCVSANTAFAKIIGTTPEECLTLNFRDIRVWKETDLLKDAEETLLTGKIHQNEIYVTTTYGKKIRIEYRFLKFLNKNRPHLLLLVNDITERKKTEDSLLGSQANLKAIIENTDASIYSLDRDFRYITFNKLLQNTMKGIYGLNIKPGDNVYDFLEKLDPAEAFEWQQVYSRALTGEIVKFEKEFSINNFHNFISFSIHPIWENKNVTGLSCFALDITKQKQSDTAFRQSEFRYRQIVETAQEGIWLIDENNRTTFVNKKMCDILEYSEEEMMGKENFYFMDDAGKLIASETLKRRKKGLKDHIDMRFITKSGKNIWTNVSANPIFDEQANYKGALGMVSDITEKKNLENLLDKTNSMARIGLYEIDLKNKTLYWSAITKEIHEVQNDFIPDVETAISFYKPGINRDAFKKAVNEAIEKNIPFDLELQIVTGKGNDLWIRVIGEAECRNGSCTRVYGSFQDIDKIKKAEIETLKIYEEKNTILESIGDAFFAVDKYWVVTYWNRQAEKMLRTSKNNIIGRYLWEVFSDSIDSESYRNYHLAIETRTVVRFEDYYTPIAKWYEISAYPSDNGLSVFFKDITEEKKSEDERVKMTADILQRNKDLEQFSYIISHNLRAPVANIIGLSNTLQKDDLKDDIRIQIMSGLCCSVNKLDEIIKDLNNILNGRREIGENKKVVSFTKLTRDIELSIENIVTNEKAVIALDFSEIDEMLTIESYLHSIFYNLISNSLKYRQPGIPPLITIKSYRQKDKIILCFKDNGLGIDMQKKGNQVFGLYKRFHTDRAEGRGMGLYMVKTQVEALGGKITITSEVNKGTEFKIEFTTKEL